MSNSKFTIFKILMFACAVIMTACKPSPKPVTVSRSLFHNPDSLLFWAERAYMHDDPQGLYITGAAAFLRIQDSDFPDSCTTVPVEEARIMLKRAAELGSEDARQLIHCLRSEGCWGEQNE